MCRSQNVVAAGRAEEKLPNRQNAWSRDTVRLESTAQKIFDVVHDLIADVVIAGLRPFTAVATELGSGRSVWFQRGRLHDAIRVSMAIPGVFTPHEIDGRPLADGGILNPLPSRPCTRSLQTLLSPPVTLVHAMIQELARKLDQFEVMNLSLDLMLAALTRHEFGSSPPDVFIVVPRSAARSMGFTAPVTIARDSELAAGTGSNHHGWTGKIDSRNDLVQHDILALDVDRSAQQRNERRSRAQRCRRDGICCRDNDS